MSLKQDIIVTKQKSLIVLHRVSTGEKFSVNSNELFGLILAINEVAGNSDVIKTAYQICLEENNSHSTSNDQFFCKSSFEHT